MSRWSHRQCKVVILARLRYVDCCVVDWTHQRTDQTDDDGQMLRVWLNCVNSCQFFCVISTLCTWRRLHSEECGAALDNLFPPSPAQTSRLIITSVSSAQCRVLSYRFLHFPTTQYTLPYGESGTDSVILHLVYIRESFIISCITHHFHATNRRTVS